MFAPTQSTQHPAPSTEEKHRWALLTLGIPEALHVTLPYRQHLGE